MATHSPPPNPAANTGKSNHPTKREKKDLETGRERFLVKRQQKSGGILYLFWFHESGCLQVSRNILCFQYLERFLRNFCTVWYLATNFPIHVVAYTCTFLHNARTCYVHKYLVAFCPGRWHGSNWVMAQVRQVGLEWQPTREYIQKYTGSGSIWYYQNLAAEQLLLGQEIRDPLEHARNGPSITAQITPVGLYSPSAKLSRKPLCWAALYGLRPLWFCQRNTVLPCRRPLRYHWALSNLGSWHSSSSVMHWIWLSNGKLLAIIIRVKKHLSGTYI
jgi:hypothetical protein